MKYLSTILFLVLASAPLQSLKPNRRGCECNNIFLMCYDPPVRDLKALLRDVPECSEVVVIYLMNNDLASLNFPKDFFHKYGNASLWLGNNRLTSLAGLKGWSGYGLSLERNKLTELSPHLLGENLEYLYVYSNELFSLDLSSASNLRHVAADFNTLEFITFPEECSLRSASFNGNHMNSVPHSILKCKEMKDIQLRDNLIFEMPISLVRLLSLRKSDWTNGDNNVEIHVDLRNNPLTYESIRNAFRKYHKEENEIRLHWDPSCSCATIRTRNRFFASVEYCFSVTCGENGYSKWSDLFKEVLQ